ncbi:putative repeat protein (TIGR01451 family) [Allocatelliglobosispora scoriae]|uniref:Putative repeat protein (TIGR01451 family) n=1 Tax=Allocatelliglobosispora scoriae TaxID=643052 RepID=A0A841BNR8_9ACTN|nr:DUF11 domain-containing protein [Allocatelliglobosispora scoriae]MBB5868450.1 putative repeat protein (TIGR01451 family) [Allocatelliglobosispora scoriae]
MARRARTLLHALAALTIAVSAGLVLESPAWAAAFPIDEPFSGATTNNPDWVFTDKARLTDEGDGWLHLTGTGTFEAGTAVLNDAFSTELGVNVEFEYATWGGIDLGGHRADGFSFFLMDGTFPPSIGQSGGGLGYTGIQGGYVGVGFDEFGNFSGGLGGPGQQPDTIAIRGSYAASPNWAWLTNAPGPNGSVETGDRAGFRKVRITITPNAPGQTMLSIFSDSGPGTAMVPVISDYNVATAPGQPVLPDTFKLGFSGSTGGGTNNHEIRNLVVTVPTDLSVTKTGTATVDPRGQVTYTVIARNDYMNPVSGAVITDTVPAGLTDVTWTCSGGAGASCGQPSGTGNDISVTAAMESNTGVTLTITGTAADAAAGTTITNTAVVTAPADRTDLDPTNNTASTDTAVNQFMDLVVEKKLTSASPLVFGQDATYDITVTNNGPAAASGVVLTDTIPAAFDPATVTAPGCTVSGTTLTCALGNLPAGATRVVHLTATVGGDATACAERDVTQSASASGTNADRTPDDASDTVTTPCEVPVSLAVTKTGAASVTAGGSLVYTVTVTNTGSFAAPATAITDTVPGSLIDVVWTCPACTPASGSGNAISTTAAVPAGGSTVLTITGTPTQPGSVTNTASVTPCARCAAQGVGPLSASVTTEVGGEPIPITGVPVGTIALSGAGLLIAGTATVLITRRRRSS